MPSLKEVKNRIASVSSTQQITKAMKMVSAAKLRKAQTRALHLRTYTQHLQSIIQRLTEQITPTEDFSLLLASKSSQAPLLIVPIASDKGLCGSFNSNVLKAMTKQAMRHTGEMPASSVQYLPLSVRAHEYCTRRKMSCISDYKDIFHHLSYEKAHAIATHITSLYKSGSISKALLVYNESRNVATQLLQVQTFLPLTFPKEETQAAGIDYIYEPNMRSILADLIPLYMCTMLYHTLCESHAAEHEARMTAMDKASENAEGLLKELRLSYNRTRQAVITREILEIVGGAEALKDS